MPEERAARVVIAVTATAVVAAVAVVLVVVLRGHGSTSPTPTPRAKLRPTANCTAATCAVVNLSRSLPAPTVFYGASCSGVYGSWFFNAVEGGSDTDLRPSYHLLWSFAPGSTTAMPNGSVSIAATNTTTIFLTITNGTLHLTGTQQPSTHVDATGTLQIQLSGSASAPTLTFTEAGLSKAEQAVGLLSPFDVNGQPLTVPVTTVKNLPAC